MLKVRWLKVLREVWGNKSRTILVVLSIAVGVFAVGTIANSWIVLTNDLNAAYLATNPASATLSLSPFDDGLVRAVEQRADVADAEGRRTVSVKLNTPDGEPINLSLTAVDDFSELAISQVMPEKGAWPPDRRQILLERSWEDALDLHIGDIVSVEMPNGRDYQLEVAGFVHDLHVPPAGNTQIAPGYVTFRTLWWLGEDRYYNQLYLTVAENELDENHIAEVVTAVKEDVIARNGYTIFNTSIPTPGQQFLTVIIQAILGVLGVVGLFSLLLSGALVINTVSALITRQVQQIGVMKAIGARRSQIMEIYLASVVIYGLLSLGVAVPLAVLGTRGLTSILTTTGNFDVLTTGIPPAVLLLEVFVALAVPMVAALIPIYFGARITVRKAISDYGLSSVTDNRAPLGRFAGFRVVPSTLALALRNTFRRKARLVLTVGTLTLAGAIFIAVLSVRNSLFTSFEEALVYYGYDLDVNLGEAYRVTLLEREAMSVPGVLSAEGWLQKGATRARPDGTQSSDYTVIGVPPDTEFLAPVIVEGRWLQSDDRDKIVINTDFLREENDVRVGDTLELTIDNVEQEWEVVGVVTKQYSQPIMYAGYADLSRNVGQRDFANRVVVRLAENDPKFETRIGQALEEVYKDADLLVGATTTRSDFVDTFEMRFNFLTVFLLFIAFLLAFVGGLSLAGTMGLSVLERVREIGVMRAIGASNGAMQRIILAEGVVIGMLSWALAAVLGVPLSKLLSDGVGIAFGGEPLTFEFSIFGMLVWLVLGLLIASLSSYLPARRATRLSVREVLTYE